MSEDDSSAPQHVTDDDRDELAAALIAALTLIYKGQQAQALQKLGQNPVSFAIPLYAQQQIESFANRRADLIQAGINSRMAQSDNQQQTADSIDQYHNDVLLPFLISTVTHNALIDAYRSVPADMGNGPLTHGATYTMPQGDGSAADNTLWEWKQNSSFVDDCTDAQDMSPAPLRDIESQFGRPPAHPNCRCSLTPVS